MIKVENIKTMNFEAAFRGMRNPLESWDKSDSVFGVMTEDEYDIASDDFTDTWCDEISQDVELERFQNWYSINGILQYNDHAMDIALIGPNDLRLAQKLILAGSDHSKFMRQIFVSMDITAPLYWFKELETYKIGTTSNSESTMHKIMSKPFDISMFSADHLRGFKQKIIQKPNEIDEDLEEWADWPLNNLYQVSNQGRVKRKEYTTTHNRTWKERILTNTETADNYLKVGVKIDEQRKDRRVHQLVAQTWLENPNNYKEVNHKNGNKLDNRVENLEWVSRSENMTHAEKENLIIPPVYKGKLSKEQRNEIIEKYNTTLISKRQLAKDYEVSHTTINSIFQNRYNYGEGYINEYEELLKLIDKLNELRDEWLITKDKEVWYSLIQLLPSSWNQTRTWTANYAVLRNIYYARGNHKLTEWREFCKIISNLPWGEELICVSLNDIHPEKNYFLYLER